MFKLIKIDSKSSSVVCEGSCDTEDWSNDAENTVLITGINILLFNHINNKQLF